MVSYYKIELGPEHIDPYLKVYLKDTTENPKVKDLLEDLPAVDHVNITAKATGKSNLTVYPNKAYEIKEVRDDIAAFLDQHFANGAGAPPSPSLTSLTVGQLCYPAT